MFDQFSIANLPRLKQGKCYQESSYDRTGGNEDFIRIPAGETATLASIEGTGCISRIWLTITSEDLYILRRALLKMYWDGEENPSVESPVGDFFGTGFSRYRHFDSFFLGMTSGGTYCYFPMPFASQALIQLENQSKKPVKMFYYAVTYQLFDRLPENTGRFHAKWRRDTTVKGENYLILEAKGRGHFVGCNMSMQGRLPFYPWFLEGDEMIYVDGEDFPSIHGTGTEDYFNSGWYFIKGKFCAPFHGLTQKNLFYPRLSAYRFHVGDAIPFQSSIRVTMEHGGTNDTPGSDYSSVAYWYQEEPHYEFYEMQEAEKRRPKDGLAYPFIIAKGYFLRFAFRVADIINRSLHKEGFKKE